ncbi:fused MFS/spermidine synthase [Streptomyces sp. NA04227]|uniref:spermidine synthase n=1 Tax=Streptomyces sp. NA04227 TaxID=2742136 RepID=UPI0015929A93|nr:fused MFS/spermidine synthase [Streptomyces sp. NA04227]QKW05356.1 fused MFS/spermidine synthase [Streptomyces sp. NA04227]
MDEQTPVTRAVDFGTAKLMPDVDRPRAWLLTIDGSPQSYVDLDEPGHLEFEYARRLGHVVDTAAEPGRALDVIHLGGGALTLPRYVEATRPGSRQQVVEADRALVELVAEHLPFSDGITLRTHTADARDWLETAAPDSADLILADVFGGSHIPAHLTTLPYARLAAAALRPDGLYAANLADGTPFDFLRSQLATFGTVFGRLALIAEPSLLRGRRFGNAVLVAAQREIDIPALSRRAAADAFAARVLDDEEVREFMGQAQPVEDEAAVPSPAPPSGAFRVGG